MPPINWVAVLIAWLRALGWTAADMATPDGRRRMPAGPMIASLVAELVMALMLAGIIGHLGGPAIVIGAVSGVLIWLGFVATTIAVNNAFQKRSVTLTVIDAGGWLAVLLVQGIMIGLFA